MGHKDCWICFDLFGFEVVCYSLDVEGDDGQAAGGGFEEGDVLGVVMEKVLAEGCRAEGEAAFAGRGLGGDEEEEVDPDAAVSIDSVDGGDDGGKGDDGPGDDEVGVGIGDGVDDDGFEEVRELAAELRGEGGHGCGSGLRKV